AVELELDHLARRRVPVPPEIADEPARLARPPCAVAIRHAGRALDVLVRAHVVDQRDEAVVQHREVEPEDLLRRGIGRPTGLHGALFTTCRGVLQSTRRSPARLPFGGAFSATRLTPLTHRPGRPRVSETETAQTLRERRRGRAPA